MHGSYFKKREGISLVELLIVLALIGMVIAVVFSLFFFGNHSFTMSRNQFDVQSAIRFAIDGITQEVRFATDLEILHRDTAKDPNQQEEGYSYFYFTNGKLFHAVYNEEIHTHVTKIYDGPFEEDLSLFSKIDATTLAIKIYSKNQGESYKGESKVRLLNLNNGNSIIGKDELGLKYRKNSD